MFSVSNWYNEGLRTARPPYRPLTMLVSSAVIASVLACTDVAPQPMGEYTWSRDTLVAHAVVLRDPDDSTRRDDLIGRPEFVRASDGLMFVSDVSVDRVAVLDSAANVVRWIGNRGRGPGELLGVGHLEISDRHLLVAEALNGRVSEFTFDGTFVRAFRSPFAAGSVSATSTARLAISRSTRHYAIALRARDDASNALRRPPVDPRLATSRWSTLAGHDLLAADSARFWVFDQATGNVCEYAHPHATPRCRALPRELSARLRAYRDHRVALIENATGQHVRAAPLVKDMVRVGNWLALLLPLPDLLIALIDVNDGTLTPVVPLSLPIPSWSRAASSLTWDGRGFLLAGDDGIGRLLLSHHVPTH